MASRSTTARGHLYWTQKGPVERRKGRIFRAGLEIPTPDRRPRNRTDIEVLWDGCPSSIDLEIKGDWLLDRRGDPRPATR